MKTLLFILGLLGITFGFRFSADIRETDPSITGTMTGSIFYDDSSLWIKIVYNTPGAYNGQVIDITSYKNVQGDANSQVHYLLCSGTCDAESISWSIPTFTVGSDSGLSPITLDGRTCSVTTFPSNSGNARAVHQLWTSNGAPCRARFGGGRVIDFSNVRTSGLSVPNWAGEVASCPAKQCKVRMDLEFVLDESGSIVSSDWTLAKSFVNQIIDGFEIGANAVRVGVVKFDNDANIAIPMENSEKASLKNRVTGLSQGGSTTCIPCGLNAAVTDCNARCRANVYKLLIVMTDGANNVQTGSLGSASASAKNRFNLVLAIGVGPAVVESQLITVASTPSSQVPTTVFKPSSFSALRTLVSTIVAVTCQDLPGNPCGSGCKGFCGCKGGNQVRDCLCPSTCEDNDFCTLETCNPLVNSAGCTYSPRDCRDANLCTTETCNSATSRCDSVANPPCNDGDLCTEDSCVPASGCLYRPVKCFDNDGCTQDTCNPGSGCLFPPIVGPCDECNRTGIPLQCTPKNCFLTSCNPATGECDDTPIDCDDGNACTADSCNPTTGQCVSTPITCNDASLCTTDSCNPATGCVYTPIVCNDKNACTNDSCIDATGCLYTPFLCHDNNNCTDDICDSVPDGPDDFVAVCHFFPKKCETNPFILAKIGNCYVAKCDYEIAGKGINGDLTVEAGGDGCYIEQLPNTTVDECGCCAGTDCFCGAVVPPKDDASVVGGLALAAILLLILGVVGIIALLGGKTGYDIYLRNRGNMTGANTNPLYNAQGMAGTNPMYSNPDA